MRIVSLLPAATELVCALGLRDALVGVSHECDFPAGVDALPQVTSSILEHGLTPAEIDRAVAAASLERRPLYAVDGALLNELRPDLIVTQGVCAVCAVTPETIAGALALTPVGKACDAPVVSLGAADFGGICDDIEAVARAADVMNRADGLLHDLSRRWEELAGSAPDDFAPSLLMLEWPDPPWFGGHWVPEQVAVAGGDDPFGRAGEPSGRLTWDRIADADPDYVIGVACGYDAAANAEHLRALIAGEPRFAELRAVREGRAWAVDANGLFSRPGPRVVDGAELLRSILVGAPVRPRDAVRVAIA